MEEIKRYIVGFDKAINQEGLSVPTPVLVENKDGELVKHEDHIAALRDIFKDWPGVYPTEDGEYYFSSTGGNIEIDEVEVLRGIAYFVSDGDRVSSIYKDEQCGPRVPMWRKV